MGRVAKAEVFLLDALLRSSQPLFNVITCSNPFTFMYSTALLSKLGSCALPWGGRKDEAR